ncbi:19773_t:CDS:2, partial [Rhizophagus irregularis]
ASQQKVESDTSVIPYTDSDDSISDSLREKYKGYRRKKGLESTKVSSSKGAEPSSNITRKNRKKLRKSQRVSDSEDSDDDVKQGDLRKNCQISDNEDADNKIRRKDSRKNRWVEDANNKVKRKDSRKNQQISDSKDVDDDVKQGDLRKNCQISNNEDVDNKVRRKDSRKNRWVEDADNKVKRKDSRKNQQISDSEDMIMITSRRKSKNRQLNSDEGKRKRAEENSSFETEEESIEKESRRHSNRPLINAESVGFKRYNNLNEMEKDLKEALHVFWNITRMPDESQLDRSKTFESQKKIVIERIIPTIKQLLDPNIYPISENVIYQIIKRRHHSQRNTYRINNKDEEEKKKELKRKHRNTRRSEKRRKRTKVINNLKKSNDRLLGQFNFTELEPITKQNCYHSPEESDEDNNIIVKDLSWRSDTLHKFLRNYLDKDAKEVKRVRTYGDHIADERKPVEAPKWTLKGYNGELKRAVSIACDE